MTRTFGLLLLVAVCGVGGCANTAETRRFKTRVIRDADPDAVFAAVQTVMRREFGRIRLESRSRSFTTDPVAYQTTSESGTARDLYGAASTMRQIARCSVGKRRDGAIVRLRVDIQRQDTRSSESLRQDQYRLSDAPAYTPIERDAATSEEQNTVWTFVRRNARLERELLAEIENLFAPEPKSAPPPQPEIEPHPE